MKKLLLKFRLGTTVKFILKPLVWTTDFLVGSDLKHCESCQARAIKLNDLWVNFINWLLKD